MQNQFKDPRYGHGNPGFGRTDDSSGGMIAAFVGIPSFLRSPIVQDLEKLDADIAIIGAPTDAGSPFAPGSRFAPRSIREHSLRFGNKGYYDPIKKKHFLQHEMAHHRLVDIGDASILPSNPEDSWQNITATTAHVVSRGAMPVVLGGDHAIAFPVVRGIEKDLHVIHFDAHMDYAPFVHGYQFTNGHCMRLAHDLPHVKSITQVGIRSLRTQEFEITDSRNDGNSVVTMDEFNRIGPSGIAEFVPRNARCYVTIDIDVLDMTLIPGCVSAEPNGMSYSDLRDTLFAIAERTEVVGFDLAEVNPQLDVGTGITSYLGAHTIIEFLGAICDQPRWVDYRESRIARVTDQPGFFDQPL